MLTRARRRASLAMLLVGVSLGVIFWAGTARSQNLNYSTEIRHHQVVFYVLALEKGDIFHANCSTYFNSTIHMFLLNSRPVDDNVNEDGSYKESMYAAGYVNASDVSTKPNASLSFTTGETKIFYLQFVQQDKKTDFLLVDCTHELTRYYIPFLPGYPMAEMFVSLLTGLGIAIAVVRRKLGKIKA